MELATFVSHFHYRVRFLPILILLAIIATLLYMPLQLNYDLVSLGRVYASREWTVMQDPSGSISAKQFDRLGNAAQQAMLFQFERGDQIVAQLELPPDSTPIKMGDTLLRVQPRLIFNRINELKGQLAVAEAILQSETTGEKNPIVAQAQQAVEIAKTSVKLAQQDYNMQAQLMRDSLISVLELRTASANLETSNAQLTAAEAFLRNVNTGVKPEAVVLAQKQIALIQTQISQLQNQQSRYFLLAPFDGKLHSDIEAEGVLFTLIDESKYLLHVPIKVEDLRFIPAHPSIEVTDILTGKIHVAPLHKIPQEVQIIGGRRVVFLQAVLDNPSGEVLISTGMSLDCRIRCGKINQREYIKRMLRPQ